ncbi:hypothetical protein QFZ32_005512 [Streptomyces canus]|nr:hypothetical protein [Streptomyces canus]
MPTRKVPTGISEQQTDDGRGLLRLLLQPASQVFAHGFLGLGGAGCLRDSGSAPDGSRTAAGPPPPPQPFRILSLEADDLRTEVTNERRP